MKASDKYSVEKYIIPSENGSIYGELYIPDRAKKVPLLIISHGFTGSYRDNIEYAKHFASMGYAVYIYDFFGGSNSSKSGGKLTDMSVMTEVKDLEAVIDYLKQLPFIDKNEITLIGKSQGGVVSAIVSARHPEDVKNLVMIYPALVIHDDAHKILSGLSLETLPETYEVFDGVVVGKKYAQDIWDYDVYDEMKTIKSPVLLLHGTEDQIVPISYSDKAAEILDDVEYHPIEGAGHGFSPEYAAKALELIEKFLKSH